MKSLVFIFMLGMSVMSCGHTEPNTTTDVDSTAVDSTAVDSIDSVSDSITE